MCLCLCVSIGFRYSRAEKRVGSCQWSHSFLYQSFGMGWNWNTKTGNYRWASGEKVNLSPSLLWKKWSERWRAEKKCDFFFFFGLFKATPTAYGGSQARVQIGSTAAGLHHSHSSPGFLIHWARPGIKPATSQFLVRLFPLGRDGNSETLLKFPVFHQPSLTSYHFFISSLYSHHFTVTCL